MSVDAAFWVWPLAMLVALAVDRLWGEPPARWHPVVWMGHALGWAGARVAPLASSVTDHGAVAEGDCGLKVLPENSKIFWHSALYWCAMSAMVVALAGVLQAILLRSAPGWAVLGLGLLLKPLLAWRMLCTEVQAVETALGQSLAAGRERLGWLVSRDVAELTEAQVRESAIESLAENLNDSVVAPLFWFAVAGLPGAALYRFANTADAMWGYRTVRGGRQWEWAGKWAARADDVLSWLPARLTGWALAGLAGPGVWPSLPTQARQTPSPNSGWPMAAMALALGVRLGKPGVYVLNPSGRTPVQADTVRAINLCKKGLLLLFLIGLVAISFISWGVT